MLWNAILTICKWKYFFRVVLKIKKQVLILFIPTTMGVGLTCAISRSFIFNTQIVRRSSQTPLKILLFLLNLKTVTMIEVSQSAFAHSRVWKRVCTWQVAAGESLPAGVCRSAPWKVASVQTSPLLLPAKILCPVRYRHHQSFQTRRLWGRWCHEFRCGICRKQNPKGQSSTTHYVRPVVSIESLFSHLSLESVFYPVLCVVSTACALTERIKPVFQVTNKLSFIFIVNGSALRRPL